MGSTDADISPHLGELTGEISRLRRGGDSRAGSRREVGARGGLALLDGAGGDYTVITITMAS